MKLNYFFFAFALLLDEEDFFEEDFAALFFAVAIRFHHLSCRTGPHGRAYLAKIGDLLRRTF